MKTTRYALHTTKPGISFKACIVADLHDRPYDAILSILEREKPDLILIPGDLSEALDRPAAEVSRPGLGLLSACTYL